MKTRIILLVVTVIMAATMTACGIYSFTGASYGTAKTVSVDFFQNRSSYVNPTLSSKVTEDLKNRFMSQTPLALVTQGGDLHFEGAITGYTISTADIKAGERAANNRLTITLKVTFTNQTAPENDFDQTYTRYADYSVSQSFASVESTLVEQIVEELINDIFNDSVVNW
ncbi:MAG: hypothetical protein J5595_01990 [Bacteroidales bacterium]|nr:hypothetical protein [Bacteroidales bacterium]